MRRAVPWTVLLLLTAMGMLHAQGDEAVLLRYKFHQGEVLRTIEIVKGTIPVRTDVVTPAGTPAGGAGIDNMAVSVALETTAVKVLTVNSVDANGVAAVTIRVERLLVNTNTQVGDQTMSNRLDFADGKLTASGTGVQEMPPDKLQQLEQLLNTAFQVEMDPLGGTKPIGQDVDQVWQQAMGQSLAGVDFGKLSRATMGLPEQPVKVGDIWENSYEPGENEHGVTGSSKMLLAALTSENGHQVAKIRANSYLKIEDQDAKPVDGMMLGGLTQGMQTKLEFLEVNMASELNMDLELGQMLRTASNITMNMDQTMSMDLGAAFGGQQLMMTFKVQTRDAPLRSQTTTMVE